MQALRIARPTDQLDVVAAFYRDGVGLVELSRFEAPPRPSGAQVGDGAGHEGFSGRILGRPDLAWHLELVTGGGHTYGRAPNAEHLLAIYHADPTSHEVAVDRIAAAGGVPTTHPNPWWNDHASTWLDPDGYPLALVPTPWHPRGP